MPTSCHVERTVQLMPDQIGRNVVSKHGDRAIAPGAPNWIKITNPVSPANLVAEEGDDTQAPIKGWPWSSPERIRSTELTLSERIGASPRRRRELCVAHLPLSNGQCVPPANIGWLSPGKRGFEERTFECSTCRRIEKHFFAVDLMKTDALGWFASESRLTTRSKRWRTTEGHPISLLLAYVSNER